MSLGPPESMCGVLTAIDSFMGRVHPVLCFIGRSCICSVEVIVGGYLPHTINPCPLVGSMIIRLNVRSIFEILLVTMFSVLQTSISPASLRSAVYRDLGQLQPMQQPPSDTSEPINELRKGMPLHACICYRPLHVKFKTGSTDLFYCTALSPQRTSASPTWSSSRQFAPTTWASR